MLESLSKAQKTWTRA